jgi:NADH dehydrogenase FAD-containing subunit
MAALGEAIRPTAAVRDNLLALRDHVAAGFRWIASSSSVAEAGLLLAARIWLSQAVFVHGIMMMMQSSGFIRAPSGWTALLQGILPVMLAVGTMTRPVALILLLGGGLAGLEPDLSWPHRLLLIWLLAQGAGPLSLDFLMRGGLARVPVWGIRAAQRLYGAIDRLTAEVLPFGTRICLAVAIAGGAGLAIWPQPISDDPLTAPWWLLVLGWFFMTGLLTRPVALLFCGLAPLASLAGTGQDATGVMLLLLLVTARGAGKLSLDWIVAQAIASGSAATHGVADELPHVVVVGGGFGGIATVRALRSTACRITLIDRRNHTLFQPLLYQVATAALSPADIAAPIRSVVRGQQNVQVRLGEVTGLDLDRHEVTLRDTCIHFDFLVLATGAQHSYFGRDDWAHLAPGLKSIEDATAMRGRMLSAFEQAENMEDPEAQRACLTFVVVGGGPTGVELAGALAELARTGMEREYRRIDPRTARVILVQSAPRLLPAFSAASSMRAENSLIRLGVEVLTSAKVTGIDAEGVDVNSMRIRARTTFWAAGVTASPAARWLGAAGDRSGRVVVGDDLAVADCPRVFAIGDTAASNAWAGKPVPGLAPAAKQQGHYVACVIEAAVAGKAAPSPFQYRHYGNLATIGRLAAVAELGRLSLWGAPAWWFWGLAHVLFLAGGRNRVAVTLNWLWAYVTYRRSTRLIIDSTRDM